MRVSEPGVRRSFVLAVLVVLAVSALGQQPPDCKELPSPITGGGAQS
jgi:hypothetical protein